MSQMSTEERLVYMANQIAANFAVAGRDAAAAATADHIAHFWDPRMRSRILRHLDGPAAGAISLTPTAHRAIELLAGRGAPPPQTLATIFDPTSLVDGSDAG